MHYYNIFEARNIAGDPFTLWRDSNESYTGRKNDAIIFRSYERETARERIFSEYSSSLGALDVMERIVKC